jgi:mannose-6-phosphate isomerase-like protein (cupin superfamily)
MDAYLHLDNRHTGEWLRLRRVIENGVEIVELEGGVPPRGEGPPYHVHVDQAEEGFVVSGELTAMVGGRRMTAKAGESVMLPAGVPHRWWNEGAEPLVFKGRGIPAGDLDSFLQAIFAIVNAAPKDRPSLFHLAHLLHRSRHSYRMMVMPLWLQRVLFPAVIAVGHVVGAYPKAGWPGSPGSCTGAPLVKTPAGVATAA